MEARARAAAATAALFFGVETGTTQDDSGYDVLQRQMVSSRHWMAANPERSGCLDAETKCIALMPQAAMGVRC
jgi:hypothetical protein